MNAWSPSEDGELVRLLTLRNADGVPLDGVVWEPVEEPVAGIVYLHGMGGNFYTGPGRFVPQLTRDRPLLQLAMNLRCHDLGTTRFDVPAADMLSNPAARRGADVDGGVWERIAEGHLDVAAGVAWMRERGVERVFLAGHSLGGFYVGQYGALHDDIAGRILVSPLTSHSAALPAWFDSDEESAAAVARARRMIAAGEGELLIALPRWYYAISARSLVERAGEPPDAWEQAMAASDVPTLWIWGDAEARHDLWERLYQRLRRPGDRRLAIAGAEHYFLGHEQTVTDAIVGFVTTTAGGSSECS